MRLIEWFLLFQYHADDRAWHTVCGYVEQRGCLWHVAVEEAEKLTGKI